MMGMKKAEWLIRKVLLVVLIVSVTACGEGPNEKELMERAKVYLESRDLSAAILELKNVLRKDVNNAEARYLLGKISLDLGDVKTAQKEMSRALDAGWDEGVVQVSLAEVLFRQGQYQKVLDDIAVKDSYPDVVKADLIGFWALSEAGLGKWDEAEQTIKAGESITADSVWLSQSKIRLAVHREDMLAAGQALQAALKAFPDSQNLWLSSVDLAEKNDDLESAKSGLQKVIDLDPARNITVWGRQARLALGQIWLKQQDYEKAQAVIDPVLKAYPGDPFANYLGGVTAFRQGEYDLTEERLQRTLKVMPEYQPALLLFGALNFSRRDYHQAVYYLEKVAVSQPENIGVQTLLGRTYLMLEEYDEAESRLKIASSKTEDNAELLALIGISRIKSGKTQAGIQELEKAVAAAPKVTAIRNELARAYMVTGETDRAIKELELALGGNDQQLRTEVLLFMANLQAGDFNKALDLATGLSEQLPKSPLPHNFSGISHEGKKDFPAARTSYQAALRIEPGNSMALLGLARLAMHSGEVEVARNHYQAILDKQADNYSALVALARLYAREAKVEKMLEMLEKARKAQPAALEPRLILANYYLGISRAEKAKLYINEALTVAAEDPRVLLLAARVQLDAGDAGALLSLENLAESLPKSADVHFYLAQAKVGFRDLPGARQSLRRSLALKPEFIQARYVLGNVELLLGNIDAAKKISQKLKASHPENVSGYLLEGDLLMAQSKFQAALSVYQRAMPYAQNGEAVIRINRVHRANSNSAAGYEALHRWLDNHPDDIKVRGIIAMISMADGHEDAAIVQYELIIKQQPDNAAVLNDLAWLYSENGRPGALEMVERAHRLAPDNAAIQDTYGWLLVKAGRVESGLIKLEQAASKLPESLSIRYHLAVALSRAGEGGRAKKELGLILAADKPFPERDEAEAMLKRLK